MLTSREIRAFSNAELERVVESHKQLADTIYQIVTLLNMRGTPAEEKLRAVRELIAHLGYKV